MSSVSISVCMKVGKIKKEIALGRVSKLLTGCVSNHDHCFYLLIALFVQKIKCIATAKRTSCKRSFSLLPHFHFHFQKPFLSLNSTWLQIAPTAGLCNSLKVSLSRRPEPSL